MGRGLFILAGVILALLLIPGIWALSISVDPVRIQAGDPVTIVVEGLEDNATFSLQLQGRFAVISGGEFSFETRNLVVPFTLNDGTFTATMQNTDQNVISVTKGDTEVRKVGVSTNGMFQASESGDIPSGTYDKILLGGTGAAGANQVIATVHIQGIKQGPEEGEITFVVDGITDGTVEVAVVVDGETALSRTITIGNPAPTRTASPGQGGGGGITSTVGTSTPAIPATGTQAVTRIVTPTVTVPAVSQTISQTIVSTVQSTEAPPAESQTKTGLSTVITVIAVALGSLFLTRRPW
ncbi:MAG: hypothetical protein LUQ01_04055 [Methanolinea sp.]|nr:hypothetical protein [Methanolinea sp.]